MTQPNPLHLANTAQNMARSAPKDDAVVFNKVALICMGTMAAASVVQMLQPVWRSLIRGKRHCDDEKDGGRSR